MTTYNLTLEVAVTNHDMVIDVLNEKLNELVADGLVADEADDGWTWTIG